MKGAKPTRRTSVVRTGQLRTVPPITGEDGEILNVMRQLGVVPDAAVGTDSHIYQ